MLLGYGTNCLGDVDPLDAIGPLGDLGYESLAITLDRHTIDPYAADLPTRLDHWRAALDAAGMARVIETGARHLLDPRHKHEPTLVSTDPAGRRRRVDFLCRAIDVAVDLGATCVSLWSGIVRDSAPADAVWERLASGLGRVLDHAAARGVVIAFEPEPGMAIDTLDRYDQLLDHLDRPDLLRLTIDVGHLECMGERPLPQRVAAWAGRLANVHIDDMLSCRHEHLPLGSGDVDFPPVVAALAAGGYSGGLHVELPRQSHQWYATARQSADFLTPLLAAAGHGRVSR